MFNIGNIYTKKGYKIIDNVYYFKETPTLDANNYIISNKDKTDLTLIDTGNGISFKSLIEEMEKLNLSYKNIKKVILTHIHVDHLLGIYPLLLKMNSNPPKIYAFGHAARTIKNADISAIFPGSLGLGPQTFKVKIIPIEVNELTNNQEISCAEYKFRIIHTPGHSEGSICLYDQKNKILISGDVVFSGGAFGRFDFPGGSLKKLKNSIKIISQLDVKYLLPGHMSYSANGNKEIKLALRIIESTANYFF